MSSDASYLCCLVLQHRLQLFHHKLTDGACWGVTDTYHALKHKTLVSRECIILWHKWFISLPIAYEPQFVYYTYFSSSVHFYGREKLGSRDNFGSRDSLSSLKLQHGNGLLHSGTETGHSADFLGLLRTEDNCLIQSHATNGEVFPGMPLAKKKKKCNLDAIPQHDQSCNMQMCPT